MSCDFTKLEYLEETKRLFRDKIDPNGEKITDETPFRDYVGFVAAGVVAEAALFTQTVPLNLSTTGANATIEEISTEEV